MRVLVIGQGGREHALVKAFSLSPSVSEIHAIPGNPGMRKNALCHDIKWQDTEALIKFCLRTEIDFVFIGPEDPLVAGLADRLRERGILTIGPSAEGAKLEGSKIFAKQFMSEAGIPTANFQIVSSVNETMRALGQFTAPYVLKADGLAAGKGVFICKDADELKAAATDIFEKQTLGAAGSRALLEQYMPGWELSYLVLTNGSEFTALPVAQDHKRLGDDDLGPNTGGMGTVAPLKLSDDLSKDIEEKLVRPTLQLLTKRAIVFRGVIFLGVMVTEKGPQLLEYNCRLGDPETQVILPLIESDWALTCRELAQGKLQPPRFKNIFGSCVVLAAENYPASPKKGVVIEGDLESETDSSYFIHAGTALNKQGQWTTNGGRVLCALGLGNTLEEALDKAYKQAAQAQWPGRQMRKDIGKNFPR